MLIQKGLKVLEVSSSEKFIDVNIEPINKDNYHIILRAAAEGKPEYIDKVVDGIIYKAVKVAGKIYVASKA